MLDGGERGVEEHAGTGVAHHLFDAGLHLGAIAVYPAELAHRLFLSERTLLEAGEGIGLEGFALCLPDFVVSGIKVDHDGDDLLFALDSCHRQLGKRRSERTK